MLCSTRAQPCPQAIRAPRKPRQKEMHLLDLPVELGELLLRRLDAKDLSVTACVCKLLNKQANCAMRWKNLFEKRFGIASPLQAQAALLAGGWKALYICKIQASELRPCSWEVQAALETIKACTGDLGLACCALIDGSGSMSAGDFESMTDVVTKLSDSLQNSSLTQLSVIQFSGRTQVEVPLQKPEGLDCSSIMKRVTRMNGGTNMAAACSRAAEEMAHLEAGIQRAVILMSDFRIDDYSANEALAAAKAVVKEHPNTTFFAFGVGRFVDLTLVEELLSIGSPPQKLDTYLLLGSEVESPIDDY